MARRMVLVACGIVMMAVAAPVAAIDFNLVAGLDFNGEFDVDNIGIDSDQGFSLGVEVALGVTSNIEVGVGAEYGFSRGPDEPGADDVNYTNFYGVARLNLIGREVPVYLLGRIGYGDVSSDDILDADLSGGGTWSVGAGVEFLGKVKLELLLNNFNADIEVEGLDTSFDYETYSLRVVYTF